MSKTIVTVILEDSVSVTLRKSGDTVVVDSEQAHGVVGKGESIHEAMGDFKQQLVRTRERQIEQLQLFNR